MSIPPSSSHPLIFSQAYIKGAWTDAIQGQTFEVRDPYRGEVITRVPCMDQRDVERAIDAAERALPAWSARLPQARAQLLNRWRELILEHRDALAELMVLEQGKPYAEARGEVSYGASFIE